MVTYILQYRIFTVSNWANLADDNNYAVEFVTKNGAISIAKTLSTCENYPTINAVFGTSWRCVDSHGGIVWTE